MQVNLNDEEIEMLDHALTALESAKGQSRLIGDMLGAMLIPKDQQDLYMAKRDKEARELEVHTRALRIQCALLRAKLFGASIAADVARIGGV